MTDLVLVGAGGLAREVLALLRRTAEYTVVGLLDEDPAMWGRVFDGVPVLGGLEEKQRFPLAKLLLCVGRGTHRHTLANRLDGLGHHEQDYATVVHDSVAVPDDCTIAPGSVLLAGVVLTTNVTIGRHVVVMPNVTLTHDALIEPFATLCAGVALGGNVWVGERAYLGMNSSVREGVQIGSDAVIGMGAVVLRAVPDGEVWLGVPAHVMARKSGTDEL